MINQTFIESIARALLQGLAGFLVSKGVIDASAMDVVVGSGVSIAALVWSWFARGKPTQPPSQG